MNGKKKVLTVVGTRPEAIKMAPVIRALEQHPDQFAVLRCVSGQHREMLDQVLDLFAITPEYSLDVMRENQTLPGLTSRLMDRLDAVYQKENPDLVLVHGDTTTAPAGALSAYHQRIPVGHVEAGLRTYDRYQPFPEEIHRHLVDVLSTYLFAPTQAAATHLLQEGYAAERIFITGNTVIDALLATLDKPAALPLDVDWEHRRVILVTAHRRENFGEPLEHICQALLQLVERYEDVEVIYPHHFNPNVRQTTRRWLAGNERLHLIDPLDYTAFVHLMAKSYLILTDSGGIQEEAPSLGVPVLVMRAVTERPEAVEAGTVRVVGTEVEGIVSAVARLMNPDEHRAMARAINPYGDGKAARRIVETLKEAIAP